MPQGSVSERNTDMTRLTRADDALILKLTADGRTQTEIAQVIGCHKSSVSRCLDEFGDTRLLAKQKAQHLALKVVEAAIDGSISAAKEGKPEAALEVADRLGVLEKRAVDTGKGAQVLIQIGMPGQPAGPDPVIDVPFASS